MFQVTSKHINHLLLWHRLQLAARNDQVIYIYPMNRRLLPVHIPNGYGAFMAEATDNLVTLFTVGAPPPCAHFAGHFVSLLPGKN